MSYIVVGKAYMPGEDPIKKEPIKLEFDPIPYFRTDGKLVEYRPSEGKCVDLNVPKV